MNIQDIRNITNRAIEAKNEASNEQLQALRAAAVLAQSESQKAWYALLSQAKEQIESAAIGGKNYTEVSVKNREEYRNLSGHFEADGFKCNVDGDGYTQTVCVIRW